MQYVQVYSCALQNVWTIHMPIALKSRLFSKKHGDQMVSSCPAMAAFFTLSRRRKKGKSGRRRKPKKRQGRWNRWNANSLFSVRYTLPETNSEFSPWKSMAGRWISFWDSPFCRCELLVSDRVYLMRWKQGVLLENFEKTSVGELLGLLVSDRWNIS